MRIGALIWSLAVATERKVAPGTDEAVVLLGGGADGLSRMLIVEDFLLIVLDPRSGIPKCQGSELQRICAAAVLLDLMLQHRLHLRRTDLIADSSLPITHPLLDQATQALGAQPMPALLALSTLVHKLPHIAERACEAMFRRDILHRVARWRWLVVRRWRYPLRSMQARNEALERLRSADAKDSYSLALQVLVQSAGMLAKLLDASEHEIALRRLNGLTHSGFHVDETLRIIASLRRALIE